MNGLGLARRNDGLGVTPRNGSLGHRAAADHFTRITATPFTAFDDPLECLLRFPLACTRIPDRTASEADRSEMRHSFHLAFLRPETAPRAHVDASVGSPDACSRRLAAWFNERSID